MIFLSNIERQIIYNIGDVLIMEKYNTDNILLEYTDILTVDDVMEILDIGKSTLYDLLRRGDIKNFRIGNRYKICKQSLIDYLNREAANN